MPTEIKCVYCASCADIERDHVIPAAYFGRRTFDEDKQWIEDCCATCNKLAGSAVFFSIPEKAAYILKRYKRWYRKTLGLGNWSPDEIEELGYILKVGIEQKQLAKALIQRKLRYLECVAGFPIAYKRPAWAQRESDEWKAREAERLKWEKEHRRKTYGLSRKSNIR